MLLEGAAMFKIAFLFFVSGCAALIYELLWFRQLGFIFGNTVYAATAVVTAFMTGLALGSLWIGRISAVCKRPLLWFAAFETCIGMYALLMPTLFVGIRLAYRWLYQDVSADLPTLMVFRFVLALIVMLFPTFLMGATLPLLARCLPSDGESFGRRLGWLYGVNTIGAVTGIVAGGFFLLPLIGLNWSNVAAAASNFAVAGMALLLMRGSASRVESVYEAPTGNRDNRQVRLALIGTLLAGFLALGFEVLWFRALVLVFGSTTYSFSVMLATFLAGIGLGSVVFGRLCDRFARPLVWLGVAQLISGAATLVALRSFDHQPEFLVQHLIEQGFEWRNLLVGQIAITAKSLMVPTLMMGLTFTATSKALQQIFGDPARAISLGYSWNTVGCVLGSLCAGFLLLPAAGLQLSLYTLAILACIVGAAYFVATIDRTWIRWSAATFAILLAATLAVPRVPWCREVLAAGAYFSPWNFVRDGKLAFAERLNSEELLFYREGTTATASVTRTDDMSLYFSMDGKVEADTTPRGMVVQRMIGHLPMLFHPNPKAVMNLGLGAGVTFGSLSCYPVDHLEVVEIEPAVTNVARIWNAYNHAVIEKTNAIVTINDGRNHLFCTPIKYDVITSDPFEPVVGGASHLFTVEHFRQARARLNPDGIMCQWVPMYEMSRHDFLTIIRSFVHIYPDSALFFTGLDVVMLGFNNKVHLDIRDVRAKFSIPSVSNSLADVGFTSPEAIMGMYVSDMGRAEKLTGPGPLNSDTLPIIEFSTPKSAVHFTAEQNQQVLLDNFTPLPAALLANSDTNSITAMNNEHDALRLALEASILRNAGRSDDSFVTLKKARDLAPANPVIRNELTAMLVSSADNLLIQGQLEDASHQFQTALQLNPREFWALFHMITLAMQANRPDYARATLDHALAAYPESPLIWMQKAKFELTTSDVASARKSMDHAITLAPTKPRVWTEAALLYTAMNLPEKAAEARAIAERQRRARLPR